MGEGGAGHTGASWRLEKPWWSAAAWSAVVKGALTLSTRGVSVWSRHLDSQLEMWKLQTFH